MIVANLIMAYDIKLPEGVQERYPNLTFGASVGPWFKEQRG
jgi:hypothetical protein